MKNRINPISYISPKLVFVDVRTVDQIRRIYPNWQRTPQVHEIDLKKIKEFKGSEKGLHDTNK